MGTAPKKTPGLKKPTAPKKTVASKAVSTKKVATKKAVVKKVAPKKAVKAKAETKDSKIKTPYSRKVMQIKKTKSKAKEAEVDELVEIPNSPSLRLLEKVELYKVWYQANFPTIMANTARVGGYIFIASGVLFASFSYLSNTPLFSSPAAVVCTQESCVNIADSDLPQGSPLVTFLNEVPLEVVDDLNLSIKVENSSEFTTYLTSVSGGRKVPLVASGDSNTAETKYAIAFRSLTAGVYKITTEITQGATSYKFDGPTFTVASPIIEDKAPEPVVEEVIEEESESTEVEGEEAVAEEDEDGEAGDEDLSEEATSTELDSNAVSLELKRSADSAYLKVRTGNYAPTRVEIYSEVENSNNSVFLGQATLVQSEWIFSLNALDLPVYNHVVYASFVDRDQVYKTEGVVYLPAGGFDDAIVSADSSLLVQKVNLAFQSEDFDNTSRQGYFDSLTVESGDFFADEEREFVSSGIISKLNEVMIERADELNMLLSNYAAAVQGGTDFVIRLAETQLEMSAERIAGQVKSYTGESGTLPIIKSILALRFKDMQAVVSDAERNVSIKSNSLTSRDSDNDGVANYDEVINFNTNPDKVDTDGDGVIDSVEIINLKNPAAPDITNSLVLGQSLDDVFRTETMSISGIDPLIVTNSKTKVEESYVVIRGKSIPNSFVNIIAEGSGVVGIIKAGTSGEFAYTLEKELPRGKNQISIAMVNNSGDIIALSKPFNFTNTSNSLVASASDSSGISVKSISDSVRTLPQVVTASVGVVAFGLILLILGQALRNRRRVSKVVAA